MYLRNLYIAKIPYHRLSPGKSFSYAYIYQPRCVFCPMMNEDDDDEDEDLDDEGNDNDDEEETNGEGLAGSQSY